MEDNDLMPFGKHKGKPMIDVPDSYLIWFYRENVSQYESGGFTLSYSAKKVIEYTKDCFSESELTPSEQKQ